MKRNWLYGAIAGLALLAAACANNAAPNNANRPFGTTANNLTGTYPRALNNYDRADGYGTTYPTDDRTRAFDYAGVNRRNGFYTGMGGPGVNNYTTTYGAYDGNAGSIYRDRGINAAGVNRQAMPQIGYVKTDRNRLRTTANTNRVYVDRNALAHIVGNVTASCPGVRTSTVLVTDEEVFVGINTAGRDAKTAKNQARMNAMSVSPRYYKVYVTDNQQMIDEMARIASRTTNVNAANGYDDRGIESLVRRFGDLADGDEMRTRGSNMTTDLKGRMGPSGRGTTGTTYSKPGGK
jgi:hypothetical protein